jgi:hypothetical protein
MVKGFSLAKCPAKGHMQRPFMVASIATSSGTFGALAW